MPDRSEAEFKDEGQNPNETEDLDFESTDDANKLTEWKNEPTLEDLKADLEEAQPSQDSHISDVEKWRAMYNGKVNFPTKINRSKVVPKTIRKQAEWRYTALSEPFLSADDMFEVEPITWEDKERAEQNALVLNHQMNERIDKQSFIDEYVRTAVDEGTVIVKVGWTSEKGQVQEDKPTFEHRPITDPEKGLAALEGEKQIQEMKEFQPLEYERMPAHLRKNHELFISTGQPHIPIHTGSTRVSKKGFIKNHPTLEICPYDKVTLDPTVKGVLEDAAFVIYEFNSSLSELKKDGKYKNLDRINAKNVLSNPDEDSDTEEEHEFKFVDKPRQKLIVREYWGFYDINGNGTVEPIICSWIGDVKIRMEKNPFPDKQVPFIKVKYLPVINQNYGEPDGELLADNQQIIGAVTRGMIDMMGRSAAGQQGVRKDALDVVNSRKFEDGEDYKFNSNVDPRQAFNMGEFPEIPRSALDMINLQNFEAEAITGVKSFSQGISGNALGSVATAVRGALDAASKRELGILRRLADGMEEIGRKFVSMNAEFLDDEEVIRITADEFVTVRRDDLAGHYDIKLSISTAESDNEKAQELAFMLQTVGNNLDPAMTQMILADIANLRNMPKLAKQIEEYQPQPDPMVQQMQQLEMKKLEAEIADLNAKAAENTVDVELKKAKIATEQAKARHLGSESDQKDLNFLEQKEGVEHDRDMDKQDSKNQGMLDLKAADAVIAKQEDTDEANEDKPGVVASILKNFNL